ncbi:MAG TPA: NADH-quinone oxidoreductase subunit J [Polyangiaceae bacterium]|jgi:NADH-quinone oxidoreductase subunit J
MVEQIGFGVIAAALLFSALRVVSAKNLVHAVLWLAVTLSTTAVLFVWLSAAFLAAIQILLYTGGVITLMLFGVMLTRRTEGVRIENEAAPKRSGPALVAAAALFGLLAAAVASTEDLPLEPSAPATIQQIGRSFLTEQVLAFEVLSLLLLAAMIGAIVVARRRDYESGPQARVEGEP